jgi:glycosyltransferase involved in cell wall biosynthesis
VLSPPAYSVVIPLWNKEREVGRAIASVLVQSVGDIEVIVVNDGSTDAGRAVVDAVEDPRIRVLDQANAGVSAARNTGIAAARGTFVAFLDADDQWLPDFLERVAGLARRFPDASVFGTGVFRQSHGVRLPARVAGVSQHHCGIVPNYFGTSGLLTSSSVVVRRSAFDVVGRFALGIPFGEDLEMWFRLASRFPVAFDGHPAAVLHCDASNRATNRELPSGLDLLTRTLREVEAVPEISDEVKRAARAYVAGIGLADVQRRLALGQVRGARSLATSWRRVFKPTIRYWLLMTVSIFPERALQSLGRAGSRLKGLAASLRGSGTGDRAFRGGQESG